MRVWTRRQNKNTGKPGWDKMPEAEELDAVESTSDGVVDDSAVADQFRAQ